MSTAPGNTGNLLEFDIPPGNTGNLLKFNMVLLENFHVSGIPAYYNYVVLLIYVLLFV